MVLNPRSAYFERRADQNVAALFKALFGWCERAFSRALAPSGRETGTLGPVTKNRGILSLFSWMGPEILAPAFPTPTLGCGSG